MPSHTPRLLSPINRRWIVVGVLVIATLVLGFRGFQQYYESQAESRSAWDVLYLTLQLFTLESGAVDPPVPPLLQWARFLGALASVYAIILTLMQLFTGQLQRALIGLSGGHVIVCGLGRKGERLVEQLRSQNRRVVVIEADESNSHLSRCRELGCYVVIGRSDNDWSLQKAFVSRASTLLSLAGDDGVNVETAVRAHDIAQTRHGEHLRCVIHVSEPKLQSIFKQHDIYNSEQDPFDLEFVNSFELSARVMAREAEAAIASVPPKGDVVHYLIVGLGHFGQALLKRILKDWHVEPPANRSALQLMIVDRRAEELRRQFEMQLADLASDVEVSFVQIDVHDRQKTDETVGLAITSGQGIDVAFVCLDGDAKASYTALTLRTTLPSDIPILVRMSEEAGLATLLGTKDGGDGVVANVRAIGQLDVACDLESVMGGMREILAQAIHQGYIQDQLAAGKTVAENPSMRPWHRLSDHLKETNREQADHIHVKLGMIGCELVPKPERVVDVCEFTEEEVRRLAPVEHQRWLEQLQAEGWTWGEKKNEQLKTNPSILPWSELPDEVKGYNYDAIRRIPTVLARADFEIHRLRG